MDFHVALLFIAVLRGSWEVSPFSKHLIHNCCATSPPTPQTTKCQLLVSVGPLLFIIYFCFVECLCYLFPPFYLYNKCEIMVYI